MKPNFFCTGKDQKDVASVGSIDDELIKGLSNLQALKKLKLWRTGIAKLSNSFTDAACKGKIDRRTGGEV